MSHQESLYQWQAELKRRLPTLSMPQAMELALWSIGMVLAKSASLTAVSVELTLWLEGSLNTVRQRLREWYRPAQNKSGLQRKSMNPQQSFADLAIWIVSLLPDNKIALALDASTRKNQLTVLCVSVLVAGCAVPMAWRVLPGNEPGHWKSHWLELLNNLDPALPSDRKIIVLTDRGLWAPWLFQAIVRHHWHPLMRVNARDPQEHGSYFREAGQPWRALSSFAPKRGQQQCLEGHAFKKHALSCRLIVFFGEDAKEPWYLLTDLSIDHGSLYGLRFWIEHQFKQIKSDGWDWEQSRVTACDRSERLWLAYAISLLWVQSFGSQSEADDQFDEKWLAGRTNRSGQPVRIISLFLKGLAVVANRIRQGASLQCPMFQPSSWAYSKMATDTS